MGIDYRGIAVIGMKIMFPLYVKEQQKAFEHDFPPNYRYHPVTGCYLYKVVTVPISGFDPEKKTYLGFPVVWSEDNELEKHAYVAYLFAESGESRGGIASLARDYSVAEIQFAETQFLDGIKDFVGKLTEAGVFDPGLFGLWSILQ